MRYLFSPPLPLQPKLISGSLSYGQTLLGSSSTGDTRGNFEPAFTQLSLSGDPSFEISCSEFLFLGVNFSFLFLDLSPM